MTDGWFKIFKVHFCTIMQQTSIVELPPLGLRITRVPSVNDSRQQC